MSLSIYLGVISIGLLHGLEPGHGWPLAALYSLKRKSRYGFGLLSSLIIAFFHFVSSIAVVLVFMLVGSYVDLSSIIWLRYVAVGLLLYMAYRFWTSHEHAHMDEKTPKTLWSIARFAFVLGFLHEEEFALLGFCLGNINCLLMMVAYASAVTFSIVAITLLAIHAYSKIEHKMHHAEHYLPKISAVILVVMAILYFVRIL